MVGRPEHAFLRVRDPELRQAERDELRQVRSFIDENALSRVDWSFLDLHGRAWTR